ncbi:chromosome partitioning protein ParA [Bacillus sp. GBSW19]|uniref:S8 family peptidase n=1 Tax=Bacillus sp. GBSW19 TaxID=2108545 RepID=UPI000D047C47|nr:S8 family serine peptidase [Bacillus sp. GBSW19]PRS56973.1 chromosome partitioning protein ParA [Bacillus sp. GBSW19]
MYRRYLIILLSLFFLSSCSFEEDNWAFEHLVSKRHDFNGNKVKIAVLDSGVSKIKGLDKSIVFSFNAFDNTNKTKDEFGHGTIVASLIAGNLDSKKIGLNINAEIFDIQVLDQKGLGTVDSVVKGINKAIDKQVDIINLSIGFSKGSKKLKKAIDRALKKGIIIVASAGNMVGRDVEYPAKYKGVISVSAIDINNKIYPLASKGKIDFVSPGVEVLAIDKQSEITIQSGTSFATPYVTGVISLYIEDGESIDLDFLKSKSEDLGNKSIFGNGLLKYK